MKSRVRHDKISSYLEELGRNTPENRDLVASLLGMAAPDSSDGGRATPQLLKRAAIADSSVSIVEQAARARPLILWIEDTHWLDPSSAELLQDIVTALGAIARSGGADDAAVSQGHRLS